MTIISDILSQAQIDELIALRVTVMWWTAPASGGFLYETKS